MCSVSLNTCPSLLTPASPHPSSSLLLPLFNEKQIHTFRTEMGFLELNEGCQRNANPQTTSCHCAPQKCASRASPSTVAKGRLSKQALSCWSWKPEARSEQTTGCFVPASRRIHTSVTLGALSSPVSLCTLYRAFVLTVTVSEGGCSEA